MRIGMNVSEYKDCTRANVVSSKLLPILNQKHILKAFVLYFILLFPLQATAQYGTGMEEEPGPQKLKNTGYVLQTGIDVLPGQESTSVRYWIMNGYRFNPRFSAGLGIGFTYYDDPLSLLPLFINLNYRITETGVRPFFFLNSGYNISILTDTETQIDSHNGGFLLIPGMGLEFETTGNATLYLNAGYNFDNSSYRQETFNNRTIKTDISYRRLMFGFGLSF